MGERAGRERWIAPRARSARVPAIALTLALALPLALGACAPGGPPGVSVEPAGPVSTGEPGAAPVPDPADGPDASAPVAAPVPAGTIEAPATLVTGLQAPWSIAFLDDGGALVSERDSGELVEVRPDGSALAVARIAGIAPGGEGGLLGIAVHGGHLYWYATTGAGNVVMRARLGGSAGARSLGQPEQLLDGIPAARNHNGGRIAFGPDGMLYITAGDAGAPAAAQDPASLAGKILRLGPDGDVPADNPYPGSPVYSLGHRNPQGLAWDSGGTLYATEFGQDTWDELNVIEPGADYGWPEVEGVAGDARFADPVQQWRPSEASPSGMAFADGALWIANLRGASLRRVPVDDLAASTVHRLGDAGRMRDVASAPDGALWVLTGNTDGRGRPAEGDDRILVFAP